VFLAGCIPALEAYRALVLALMAIPCSSWASSHRRPWPSSWAASWPSLLTAIGFFVCLFMAEETKGTTLAQAGGEPEAADIRRSLRCRQTSRRRPAATKACRPV
jgi:hypothetical protein